jgi:hypothetical protein
MRMQPRLIGDDSWYFFQVRPISSYEGLWTCPGNLSTETMSALPLFC